MNKRNILIIISIAAIAILALVVWGLNQPGENETLTDSAEIIYYYGQNCPHCQNVSEFLDENKISEKVNFSKKEVSYDKKNAEEFGKKAEKCGLEKEEIGVPLLYARGECVMGDEPVIEFFKKEAGL